MCVCVCVLSVMKMFAWVCVCVCLSDLCVCVYVCEGADLSFPGPCRWDHPFNCNEMRSGFLKAVKAPFHL